MAYYVTPERSPFIDTHLRSAIERRLVELFGLALIGLSILSGMMLWSYSPEDPSWLAATDAPIQNMLGVYGASFAAPIILILGWSSWAFASITLVWGIRCMLHLGNKKAFWRLVFAPFSIGLLSLYCASLVPPSIWTHSFGMGGLFGDTILQQLLMLMPFDDWTNITIISFSTSFSFMAIVLYSLGFTRSEINGFTNFLWSGISMCYTLLTSLIRQDNPDNFSGPEHQLYEQDKKRSPERRGFVSKMQLPEMSSERSFSMPRAPEFFEAGESFDEEKSSDKKQSLFALVPSFFKSVESSNAGALRDEKEIDAERSLQGDERIRSKITRVIKSRVRRTPELVVNTDNHTQIGVDQVSLSFSDNARFEPSAASRNRHTEFSRRGKKASDIVEDTFADGIVQGQTSFGTQPISLVKTEPKKVVKPTSRKPIIPSAQAKREAQPSLQFEDNGIDYELPPLNLLANPTIIERQHLSDESLEENARLLESVLDDYGVRGEIVSVRPGPVVTMYELEPAPGLKASRVIGLSDDIARSMSALSARVSTIPGKTVIGIELPNDAREKVVLREILSSKFFGDGNQKLPIALGKDIGGEPVVANLAKMPHLLIAGTTGSGKSVAINTMILSLLYKLTPEECRLIMIDPKMLELSVYDGIPHLLSPVVTDPKKAVIALKWVVGEMEERYRKMSKMGVRNIDGYNSRVQEALGKGEMFSRTVQTGFDDETGQPIFETEAFAPETMPYIVVIVDEMADLMMVSGKEIEACIQRLAQMARASGIHLIMATQRPSVDVITGTIKANFPTRISFQVTSKIDSRTILGEMGAEQLLGMGDMLYMAGGSKISRCHGPFVSDEEVEEVANHLKLFGPPDYKSGVVDGPQDDSADSIDLVLGLGNNADSEDTLYDQAVAIILKDRKCSTSYVQRKLSIGYNKAARLVEQMEDEGLITAANHVGKREILVPERQ